MTSFCSRALAFLPPVVALLGCGAAGNPLDPSSADRRLDLPDEVPDRYGSPEAYEHAARAEVLFSREEFDAAAEELKIAMAADPLDNYLRVRLALAQMESGDMKKAERNIARALKADFVDEGAWLALAEYLKRQGDQSGAEEAGRRALRIAPKSARAAMWLAEIYREKGDEKSRAEILRRAVVANPRNAAARMKLGEACLATGDKSEAVRQLGEFLRLQPGGSGTVAKLASAQIEQGELSLAAEILALAADSAPSDAELRERLVEILADLGLPERAKPYLESLPSPEPDDVAGTIDRACLLVRFGEPYEARALLASSIKPGLREPAEIVAALAGVENLLGRVEYAEALLDKSPGTLGPNGGGAGAESLQKTSVESPSCEFLKKPELTRSSY